MDRSVFCGAFQQLTGNEPFPWLCKLYEEWFAKGTFPTACNIPTGLGKTSVVAVWLVALANGHAVPRRIVYVVNRRTVVDQTTDEVARYREKLQDTQLFDPLRQMCAIKLKKGESPLAISTLRGQFADNREWSADPTRPAVIVGTVDMIGSRLLFSGYRVGFKGKPLHAGFLGQDVLLVHDEAHLEPAFQELVERIQLEQWERERVGDLPWRRLQVMALTATARQDKDGNELRTLLLTEEEKHTPPHIPDPPTEPLHVVWRRINARKVIHLHPIDDENKELVDTIASLSLQDRFKTSGKAILVFVRTVDNVEKIVAKFKKEKLQVQQLTGTMRGLERDDLPKDPIFARFLPPSNRPQGVDVANGTVYLVCTSAGEVGVNISADHLCCDLTTFESMAQRFGRVNRFGDCADTEIHIVYPKDFGEEDPYEERREKTLKLMNLLSGDASPAALDKLDQKSRQDAFAPKPTILASTDILFDSWAMTSINRPLVAESLPGRPPVEPYLHGISGDWQPPETYVAWREEVEQITAELLEQYKPEDLLEDYPLKPHELLREPSYRAFKQLQTMAQRSPETPAWLMDDQGSVEVITLEQLADKNNKNRINYRTILLPPSVGGLTATGILDGTSATATDVADQWFADKEKASQRRWRFRSDEPRPERIDGMRLVREIDLKPPDEGEESAPKTETGDVAQGDAERQGRYWRWYVRPRSADDDASKTAETPVAWTHHTNQVTRYAKAIGAKLGLPADLQKAIELAARFHDLGKKRELWQRSIGNPDPTDWHAKSGKDWKPLEITDYRHEFGSLIDVHREAEFQKLDDHLMDLVLHLIAAHHGRGRPHFPPTEIFDPEPRQADVVKIAAEVPRRFARLQRRYGRWGLAYLESLLRAADYAASASPSSSEDAQ